MHEHLQCLMSAGVIQVLDEVTHVFTYLSERDVEFWKVLDELKEIGGLFSLLTVHTVMSSRLTLDVRSVDAYPFPVWPAALPRNSFAKASGTARGRKQKLQVLSR